MSTNTPESFVLEEVQRSVFQNAVQTLQEIRTSNVWDGTNSEATLSEFDISKATEGVLSILSLFPGAALSPNMRESAQGASGLYKRRHDVALNSLPPEIPEKEKNITKPYKPMNDTFSTPLSPGYDGNKPRGQIYAEIEFQDKDEDHPESVLVWFVRHSGGEETSLVLEMSPQGDYKGGFLDIRKKLTGHKTEKVRIDFDNQGNVKEENDTIKGEGLHLEKVNFPRILGVIFNNEGLNKPTPRNEFSWSSVLAPMMDVKRQDPSQKKS